MSSEVIVVPYTKCEWDIVQRGFNSINSKQLRSILDIMNLWERRSSVPVAVEMSVMLLRACVMDYESTKDDQHGLENVRALYGMAVLRFVSYAGLMGLEANPSCRTTAQSVTKIGLPYWLVEVRNKLAHRDFPSMASCRRAAIFCRKWLWDHHWSRELKDFAGDTQGESSAALAVQLIVQYILKRMQAGYDIGVGEAPTSAGVDQRSFNFDGYEDKEILQLHRSIREFLEADAEVFMKALLSPGHLLLSKDQLSETKLTVRSGNREKWIVPETLQKFWMPLLKLVNRYQATDVFICQLILLAGGSESDLVSNQARAWVDLLLRANTSGMVLTREGWCKVFVAMCRCADLFSIEQYLHVLKETNPNVSSFSQLTPLLDGCVEDVEDSPSDLEQLLRQIGTRISSKKHNWNLSWEDIFNVMNQFPNDFSLQHFNVVLGKCCTAGEGAVRAGLRGPDIDLFMRQKLAEFLESLETQNCTGKDWHQSSEGTQPQVENTDVMERAVDDAHEMEQSGNAAEAVEYTSDSARCAKERADRCHSAGQLPSTKGTASGREQSVAALQGSAASGCDADWEESDEYDWGSLPLGLTGEQTDESLFLIVNPRTLRADPRDFDV